MRAQLLMFVYFAFMVGSILNLAIEGNWIGTEEVNIINQLTGFSALEVQTAGAWAVPKQFISFFTVGIPKLIMWDYSYFETGYAALFKFTFLYALSVGVIWGVIQAFLPVIQGVLAGVRNLLPF